MRKPTCEQHLNYSPSCKGCLAASKERLVSEFIHQSNLIEGFDSTIADIQSQIAWGYLQDHDELSHSVIQKVQKIITLFQEDLQPDQRGYYRGTNVFVGDYVAPQHPMIPSMMSNWLLDYKDLGWKKAHIRFETIHPFADGNGRTGRMLMNWQRLKEGLPILVIKNRKKADYYNWFRKSHEGVKR